MHMNCQWYSAFHLNLSLPICLSFIGKLSNELKCSKKFTDDKMNIMVKNTHIELVCLFLSSVGNSI